MGSNPLPYGILSSSVTPLTARGEVAWDLIPPHIDWLIQEGAQGISPLGSSGEFVVFDVELRKSIFEHVAAANRGRKFLLVGTHHYSTQKTIELSRHAEAHGGQGLLIVPPYYMIPTRTQVMDYYRAVADAVSIPIVLYHNFSNTHVDLRTEDLVRLHEEGAIAGVKMSNPDASRILELLEAAGETLRVYVGLDTAAFAGLCYGAHGWISGLPSFVPRAARQLFEAIHDRQDLAAARVQWRLLWPLIRLEFGGMEKGEDPHWFSLMKAALNLIGPQVNDPAPPIQPLPRPYHDELKRLLKNLGYKITGE